MNTEAISRSLYGLGRLRRSSGDEVPLAARGSFAKSSAEELISESHVAGRVLPDAAQMLSSTPGMAALAERMMDAGQRMSAVAPRLSRIRKRPKVPEAWPATAGRIRVQLDIADGTRAMLHGTGGERRPGNGPLLHSIEQLEEGLKAPHVRWGTPHWRTSYLDRDQQALRLGELSEELHVLADAMAARGHDDLAVQLSSTGSRLLGFAERRRFDAPAGDAAGEALFHVVEGRRILTGGKPIDFTDKYGTAALEGWLNALPSSSSSDRMAAYTNAFAERFRVESARRLQAAGRISADHPASHRLAAAVYGFDAAAATGRTPAPASDLAYELRTALAAKDHELSNPARTRRLELRS